MVHDANKDDAAYEEQETEVKVVMKCGMSTSVILEKIDKEDAEQRMVIEDTKKDELFKVCLQYVDVELRGEEGHDPLKVKVLTDSGAEIPVVSKDLLKGMKSEFIGKVKLQCVAGEAIPADLVKLDVRMCGDEENQDILTPYVSLVCACIEKMGSKEKFLLHPDIIAELKKSSKENLKIPVRAVTRAMSKNQEQAKEKNESESESVGENSMKNVIEGEFEFNKGKDETSSEDHEVTDACELDKLFETKEGDEENVKENDYDVQNEKEKEVMEPVQMNTSDTEELEKQQRNDKTLSEWWRSADEEGSKFYIRNRLLYREQEVLGQKNYQLVLPKERRLQVMSLAHDSNFGGHLAEEKTRERIQLSFVWPKMRSDIMKFCKSCEKCQLRARSVVMDRVPITAIPLEDEPFKRIIIDAIGPLEPASSAGHKYCLCIVDSCTRWPAVFPLKSLSAKAVCEALIELFMNFGVASVISSDRGTNFTSSMTREFERLMGSSPRFNSPGHPEASGVCERWNQTFKKMIHHAILENPRRWHKVIPFAVWAIREVPNATTGVAPFMMVYGRIPRGPLAILKESWTGDINLPPQSAIQPRKYLEELKINLDKAAQFVKEHAREKQLQYMNQYNKKAKHKEFKPGEQVIVLYPTSSNKIMSRWQGPGTVLQRRSKYSYLVDLGDGGKRILHANKMRKFIVRSLSCGLIREEDETFGKVIEMFVKIPDVGDKQIILKDSQIAHLNEI